MLSTIHKLSWPVQILASATISCTVPGTCSCLFSVAMEVINGRCFCGEISRQLEWASEEVVRGLDQLRRRQRRTSSARLLGDLYWHWRLAWAPCFSYSLHLHNHLLSFCIMSICRLISISIFSLFVFRQDCWWCWWSWWSMSARDDNHRLER